jgi:two-component system chemotaxis response regulator CheB
MAVRAQKAKVLYIESSRLIRDFLYESFQRDAGVHIAHVCASVNEALALIPDVNPDVILIDMDTVTVPVILPARLFPRPVVAFSVTIEAEPKARRMGAVEYIVLPEDPTDVEFSQFIRIMATTLGKAASSRLNAAPVTHTRGVVAIGASTGGTQTTTEIFRNLPSTMPGIVMVQHMPANFTKMYAESLTQASHLHVKEAADGDMVASGRVLLAPGEKHMELIKKGSGYAVRVYTGEKVNSHCPSVDVLFHSVARVAGRDSVGMILTGMGADGADGLLAMRRAGAYTLGQDERTSVVYGMPKEAYLRGAVVKQLPKDQLAGALIGFLQGGRG